MIIFCKSDDELYYSLKMSLVRIIGIKISESISKKLVIYLQEIKHAVQGILSAHQDDVLDHRISQIDVSYFRWLFRSELF